METNWASEHLQTIRTLMERSALYRRALAPVMTYVGAVGFLGAVVGEIANINSVPAFSIYWMALGLAALAGAFLLVRREAVKQAEAFWSPPLRRVAQAMVPALLIGAVMGLIAVVGGDEENETTLLILVSTWTLLYGLALHAAGFFMQRGIRLFGWVFVAAGLLVFLASGFLNPRVELEMGVQTQAHVFPHYAMGLLFGVSHLAYGIYLYFTERKNAA